MRTTYNTYSLPSSSISSISARPARYSNISSWSRVTSGSLNYTQKACNEHKKLNQSQLMPRNKIYVQDHPERLEILVYQVPQEVQFYQVDLAHQADLLVQEVPYI